MNIFNRVYIAIYKKGKKQLYKKALAKSIQPELNPIIDKDVIHFRHSGLIGDIIYSIPTMLTLAEGRNMCLHMHINQKALYSKGMKHPNKDKILTEKSVELLAPLILAQPSFIACDIYTDQKIDYDLDAFRKLPFDYNMGHICRWYFQAYGITADLGKPWLFVTPDSSYSNEIIISRSFRYRAPGISYGFFKKYTNITFLGLNEEYEDLKKDIPHLKYRAVKDFLEFAKIIAGCKFFIGNQSFPFAVAEGLKVKRAVEVYFECPNVIPEGENGYDFCYQAQFEKIVTQLNEI